MTKNLARRFAGRSGTGALAFAGLVILLLAAEATLIANAEKETDGRGKNFEGAGYVAYVWTIEVEPGDVVRIPSMFRHLAFGEEPPPVLFLLVEGGEGANAAAAGTAPHVYATSGPDHPGSTIELRRPAPPPGATSQNLDFVFRVDTEGMSEEERQELAAEMSRGGPFWVYGWPRSDPNDRIVVLSKTRLALASWLRAMEWGAASIMVAAVALALRGRDPSAEALPGAGTAERLARAGARSVEYLQSVRALLLFSGIVTLCSLYFGLVVLFLVLGDAAITAVGPSAQWKSQTLLLVLALASVLALIWASQVRRVQREIGRLRRLTPPGLD